MANVRTEIRADLDRALESDADQIGELRKAVVSLAASLRRAPPTRVSAWSAPLLDDEEQRAQRKKLQGVIAGLDQLLDSGFGTRDDPGARLLAGVAHAVLADHFLSAADEESARDHFRIACECLAGLEPSTVATDSVAAQYYIEALEHTGRRAEVVKFLVEVAETPMAILPQTIYLQFAWVLMRSDDFESGERILGVAAQRAAGNASELRKLANVFGSLELSRQASRHYFEAAELYLKHRDLENALEACIHALKHDQDNPQIRFLKCRLLIEKRNFDEARRELQELCRMNPEPATRLLLAEVLVHSQDLESALVEIEGVLSDNPRNPEALIARARVLNRMNLWEAALDAAENAAAQDPGAPSPAIEKVIALRGLGRLHEALAAADDNLARHPSCQEAQNAKLDILLELEMWVDAIQVASEILEVEENDALLFKRAQAYMESGHAADALRDLAEIAKPEALGPAAARLRLRAYRRLQNWPEVITILEKMIEADPNSVALRLERCDLLRRLGHQQQALEAIKEIEEHWSQHPDLVGLKTALLCDIGDFELAVETVAPLTTPIDSAWATHALLSLRAWADQNLPDEQHKIDAEAVYRRAAFLKPDDLWARKGLANALLRLGRVAEAEEEYNTVINRIEEFKMRGSVNPYQLCLCGWCYYSIGKLSEAAQHCTVGLATADVGPAYNFDYGLILLCDAYPSTAISQYAKGIDGLQSKDMLRRCGLLYVALFDILTAMNFHENLANAAETLEIRETLRSALASTLAALPSEWSDFKERMTQFIRSEEQEAAEHQAGWSRFVIAGLERPDKQLPWAVAEPVLRRRSDDGLFYRMPDDSAALAMELEPVPADSIVEFSEPVVASFECEILWISAEVIALIEEEKLLDSTEDREWQQLEWQELSSPAGSWATAAPSEVIADLFHQWASILVSRSLARLVEYFRSEDEAALTRARRLAELAVLAAPDASGKYQAIQAYGAAGGALDEGFIENAYQQVEHSIGVDKTVFDESVERFKRMAKLEAQRKIEAGSYTQVESSSEPVSKNPVVDEILKRALSIAQVENQDEQDRLAVEAAQEMKLLIPLDPAVEQHRARLRDQLESHASFVLDNDAMILLLSHTPEFYLRGVLVRFSNCPGISSIAFASARNRLQARTGY